MSEIASGAATGAATGAAAGPWGAAIGAGVGALGGLAAQSSAAGASMKGRKFARREGQKARNYNTFMSNTAHQRGVEDMRAAGLNPMLSAMSGGASAPTASPSSAANEQVVNPVENVVSSALATKGMEKDLALADQQIANQKAQKEKTKAETTLISAKLPKARLENKAGGMIENLVDSVFNSSAKSQSKNYKKPTENQAVEKAKQTQQSPMFQNLWNWIKN